MADETSAQAALNRLERAFDRIEAAVGRLQRDTRGTAIEARHRKLQEEVQVALAGLDRLLASAETH
jgi:hypothetical protein